MTDNAEAQAAPGANVAAQDGAPQPAPAAAAGEPANGAPPGKTPAEVHAAESKRRQEDEILQRARRVRQMKDAELAAQKEPFQPPSRNRSHWDVLLQEARWMATDFMQERNWKISAAVQIAREVYAQKAWKNLKKVPDAELPQAKSWVACGVKKKNAWKDFEGDWQAVDVGPYWRAGQDIEADAGAAAAGSGRSGRRGGRKGEPKAAGDERGQWEPDPIDPDLPQPAPPATAPGAAHFAYACPPTLANSLASDLEAEEAKLRAKHEAELSDHEVELEACRRAQEAARAAMAQEERARAAAAAQDAAAAGRKSGARKRVPGKQARRAGGEDDGEDLYGVRRGRRGVSDVDDEEMDGRGGRAAKRRRDMDDDAAESTGPARSSKRRQGAAAGAPHAAAGRGPMQQARAQVDPRSLRARGGRGMAGAPVLPWTPQEDNILLATVHEFGSNWLLVADIVSSTNQLSGVFRRCDHCRRRFKELQESGAVARMGKQEAREVMMASTPVPSEALNVHLQQMLRSGQALINARPRGMPSPQEMAQAAQMAVHESHQQVYATKVHERLHGDIGPMAVARWLLREARSAQQQQLQPQQQQPPQPPPQQMPPGQGMPPGHQQAGAPMPQVPPIPQAVGQMAGPAPGANGGAAPPAAGYGMSQQAQGMPPGMMPGKPHAGGAMPPGMMPPYPGMPPQQAGMMGGGPNAGMPPGFPQPRMPGVMPGDPQGGQGS